MLLISEKKLVSLFKKYESFKKLFYLGKKINYHLMIIFLQIRS